VIDESTPPPIFEQKYYYIAVVINMFRLNSRRRSEPFSGSDIGKRAASGGLPPARMRQGPKEPQTPVNIYGAVTPESSGEALATISTNQVAAGFPSPADDYLESRLDLNEHLVKHPAATFFVRVSGDSMIGAGIQSGDLLIVDRSIEASDRKVIIAVLNGEMTVKRLSLKKGLVRLLAENDDFSPVEVGDTVDFKVWGVVTHVIHDV